MKIVTPEDLRGYNHAVTVGGAKGFIGGLLVAIPASLLAQRRWQYYRSLPLSIKALGVVTVAVPAFVIAAEQAGHKFERGQWRGIGQEELERAKTMEKSYWDSLDMKGKASEWASRNKWGIILGSWGATMVGSFSIIMRDRYQTFPQKIVQARMWAQGLTVGVILASAVLSAQSRKHVDLYHPHSAPDHSWADAVIAIEARKEKDQKVDEQRH